VCTDWDAKFICFGYIFGANCDQPIISNLQFTMKLNQAFRVPPFLGAKTSTAQPDDHRVLSLQFGELPALCCLVGEFVVRKDRSGNDNGSYVKSPVVL
jgi:hypothetical protein